MSKLRAPLKVLLDEPLPELQVQRIWRRLHAPAAPRRKRRILLLSAAACVLIAGLFTLRPAPPLAVNEAGALTPTQVLGGEYPTHWPLTDGSRIELGAATRLEIVRNTGSDFAVELAAGHAGFDVQPGGPRRWSIRAGELRVEVVGTSFVVERDTRGVAVQVRHGVVLVRGPGVENGVQRLVAGQRVFVESQPPPQLAAAAPARAEASPASTAEPGPPAAASTHAPAPPPAADASAAAALPRAPAPSHTAPATLLREADQARQRRDFERAYALLERVRFEARGSVHAALASWTLGRMRVASEPARAASDIAQALQGKLPDGLREAAQARLVEAHARADDPAAARAAASSYRATYPEGRYLSEIERWTRDP